MAGGGIVKDNYIYSLSTLLIMDTTPSLAAGQTAAVAPGATGGSIIGLLVPDTTGRCLAKHSSGAECGRPEGHPREHMGRALIPVGLLPHGRRLYREARP